MLRVWKMDPLFFFDYSKTFNLNWVNHDKDDTTFTVVPNAELDHNLRNNIMTLTLRTLKMYNYKTELVLWDTDATIAARYEDLIR